MTLKSFLPGILALSLIYSCSRPVDGTEALLRELDSALARESTYEAYFNQRVDVLRDLLKGKNSLPQEYDIHKRLAEEFLAYSMDSTIFHLERCSQIAAKSGDRFREMESAMAQVREYSLAGYHSDALEILQRYEDKPIPEGLEYHFYDAAYSLYGEMAVYSSNSAQFWQKHDEYLDSLLNYVEQGSYVWYDAMRIKSESTRDLPAAMDYAMKALDASAPGSRNYAKAAFFVSTYYKDKSDERLVWLTRSAIADAMCATKDYSSLNDLASLLYERGDVQRAFNYVADHCMKDALFFNGKLRPWQIARFFPALEDAYEEENEKSARTMVFLIGIAFLSLIALGGLLFYLSRRQRILVKTRKELENEKSRVERRNAELSGANERLSALNDALQDANKIRQEYIGLFLQNLSENISTTRQYKNHVLKYIRRGNDKYLIEEIEALPPIEDDISEFNAMFDKTFINLYPDFVEKFNTLLQEGEEITPKGDDILTPELRVFALIKLGIMESSKIASLLHYSANTVYNYRAKIKNKARGDRELFEQEVQAIE